MDHPDHRISTEQAAGIDSPAAGGLSVRNLAVEFKGPRGAVPAVCGVDLSVQRGRVTALVGESGCGKSVTAAAIMGLLPAGGRLTGGRIDVDGVCVSAIKGARRRALNGRLIGMIFQDPVESLDPLYTVGRQMTEALTDRDGLTGRQAAQQAVDRLAALGLPDPAALMGRYPFELSGGMCQRVLIAAAMLQRPRYLIADEPTTALDVTVQKKILSELWQMSRDQDVGILLITHDLGVVAEIADTVYVMQHGRILESGAVLDVFDRPQSAYTRLLLDAIL